MNTNGMATLLAELLEPQVETGKYGEISKERLRASLTTGPALTEHEQLLLLLSPVARIDWQHIQQQVKRELQEELKARDIEMNILPLAAATDEEKIQFKGNGFNVTLYRQDDIGVPWIILVQLGETYLQAIGPMTTLRLVDSGGLEWLRGKPDKNGEITASWHDPDTDILARSRKFSLTLEPV